MIYSIHVARGLAALSVLLFHLGGLLSLKYYPEYKYILDIFRYGDLGVYFFFVLSGFIIHYTTSSLDSGRTVWLDFVLSRFRRVYPVYWVVFILTSFGLLIFPQMTSLDFPSASLFIKAFFLLPVNLSLTNGTPAPIIMVAWSLQFEMLFYVVYSLRFAAMPARMGLLAFFLLIWVSLENLGVPYHRLLLSPLVFLFFIGVVVAYFIRRVNILLGKDIPCWILYLGLIIFVYIGGFLDGYESAEILYYGLIFGFLVYFLVASEFVGNKKYTKGLFFYLGSSSYSLYLVHVPVISLVCKIIYLVFFQSTWFGGVWGLIFMLIVAMLAALIGGFVTFYFIERPLDRWLRKIM